MIILTESQARESLELYYHHANDRVDTSDEDGCCFLASSASFIYESKSEHGSSVQLATRTC